MELGNTECQSGFASVVECYTPEFDPLVVYVHKPLEKNAASFATPS